jgi:hypothetical protein
MPAGTYVLSWTGTAIGSVFNSGATAPVGVLSPLVVTLDGSADVVVEFGPAGAGTATLGNVQLEAGNVASAFEYRPIGTELALCQRYYYRMVQGGTATRFAFGSTISAVEWNSHTITLPVTMRVTPTQLGSGTGAISNGTSYEFTGVNLSSGVTVYNLVSSPTNIILRAPSLSGMTAFRPAWLEIYSGASYLAFSAEL